MDKISAVLSGQVDGLIGFAHDQGPTIAAKSGKKMTYLRYSDVGLNYFSNGLIVNPETIKGKPELVKAMVAATSGPTRPPLTRSTPRPSRWRARTRRCPRCRC